MAAESDMNLDRILELLAKQMGNAASESELLELEHLLKQYPNHQHLVSILRSIQSKKLKQPAQNEELVVKEGWEKLQEKLKAVAAEQQQSVPPTDKKARKIFMRPSFQWAAVWIAVVLVSAITFFIITNKSQGNAIAQVTEIVPHGMPEMKKLPDGSIVWINAGTTIRYDEELSNRNVYLEGEAYFKVAHDEEHPFVVHAGNISIQALGTEFNVTAYPNEDHVETTLIKGRVQVTMKEKPDQKIILTPNEKLTVVSKAVEGENISNAKEMSYEVKPLEISPVMREAGEVAWIQDKLAFQNEAFFDLAKRMERRYDVHIVFNDESLKKETLSGIFANENIQKALRILQMTTSFQYRIKGDSVFLNRR